MDVRCHHPLINIQNFGYFEIKMLFQNRPIKTQNFLKLFMTYFYSRFTTCLEHYSKRLFQIKEKICYNFTYFLKILLIHGSSLERTLRLECALAFSKKCIYKLCNNDSWSREKKYKKTG